MLAKDYIEKAIQSCQRALDDLEDENLQLALGDLDFVEDRINAAKILIRLEMKEKEDEK